MNRNKEYIEWFVQLNKDETGVFIFTDINFELTTKDIYFNSITGLSIIEYIFRNKVTSSKSLCDDYENITIQKIKIHSLEKDNK